MDSDILGGINRARLRGELQRLCGSHRHLEEYCSDWVPCAAPGVAVRIIRDRQTWARPEAPTTSLCVPTGDISPLPDESAEMNAWLSVLVDLPQDSFVTENGRCFRVASGCLGARESSGCRLVLKFTSEALKTQGVAISEIDSPFVVALVVLELDEAYPMTPPRAKCVYFSLEKPPWWYVTVAAAAATALAPMKPPEALTALDSLQISQRFLGESWSPGISLGHFQVRMLAVLSSQATAHKQTDLLFPDLFNNYDVTWSHGISRRVALKVESMLLHVNAVSCLIAVFILQIASCLCPKPSAFWQSIRTIEMLVSTPLHAWYDGSQSVPPPLAAYTKAFLGCLALRWHVQHEILIHLSGVLGIWAVDIPAVCHWWLGQPACILSDKAPGGAMLRQSRAIRLLCLLLTLTAPATMALMWMSGGYGGVGVGLLHWAVNCCVAGNVQAAMCLVALSTLLQPGFFYLVPAFFSFAAGQATLRTQPIGILSQQVVFAGTPGKVCHRLSSLVLLPGGIVLALLLPIILAVSSNTNGYCLHRDCELLGLWPALRSALPLQRGRSQGLMWGVLRPCINVENTGDMIALLLASLLTFPACVAVFVRPSLRRLQYSLACSSVAFVLFALDVSPEDYLAVLVPLNSLLAAHLDLAIAGNVALVVALSSSYEIYWRQLVTLTALWAIVAKAAVPAIESVLGETSVKSSYPPLRRAMLRMIDEFPPHLLSPHTVCNPDAASACLRCLRELIRPVGVASCALIFMHAIMPNEIWTYAQALFACTILGTVGLTTFMLLTSKRTAADPGLPLDQKISFCGPLVC